MPLSILKFDQVEHTVTLNTGSSLIPIRHVSDEQIKVLRSVLPGIENIVDTTGLPVSVSL